MELTKRKSIRRFSSVAIGVFASTGTTYLLFLLFATNSTVSGLGLYGLATAIVAIIVRFMDGVSGQRLFQEIDAFAKLGRLGAVNGHRIVAYLIVGGLVEVFVRLLPGDSLDWSGMLLIGQGFYASIIGTRILEVKSVPLLFAQLGNSVAFIVASLLIFLGRTQIDSKSMILINATVLIVSSIPFVVYDLLLWRGDRKFLSKGVSEVLYGSSDGKKQLVFLTGYQAANALSGSIDSIVSGFGGSADIARYQAVQRPLLGLATFNVAIGQFSMNRVAVGGRAVIRRLLLVFSPALVMWPIIGVVCVLFLPLIMPRETVPQVWIGGLIGFAYGLGALMQITGTYLMHQKRSFDLLKSTIVQLMVMLLIGCLIVPIWGLGGVACSLVLARIGGFVVQWYFVRVSWSFAEVSNGERLKSH
ncbi:lipopolysaccharide biosynthesis protein [Arthrobacter sp. ERGS1:01]|uniref:lipopolysaccharide biosynthesis protein n=1 Tax=Arthrobacter sp. ERGS1:01 TaxID=1704044 RepID=UPI000AA0F156|nr:hypothetical protein [Arthrobacter sp. ERGS1:01]